MTQKPKSQSKTSRKNARSSARVSSNLKKGPRSQKPKESRRSPDTRKTQTSDVTAEKRKVSKTMRRRDGVITRASKVRDVANGEVDIARARNDTLHLMLAAQRDEIDAPVLATGKKVLFQSKEDFAVPTDPDLRRTYDDLQRIFDAR